MVLTRSAAHASVLCLGALLGLRANAQQYGFVQYTTEDGLAQSQVRCIAQDAQGFLWFGTLGGVSRFDGHEFVNYALQEGLPDAQVSALLRTQDGGLWLGTGSGIVRTINGNQFLPVPLATDPAPRIMALAEGPGGVVYAATDERGVLVFTEGTSGLLPGYPVDTANTVRALLVLRDGGLLIGLRNGLLRWKNGRCERVSLGEGPPKSISALAEGQDGGLWVGTYGEGLYHVSSSGAITEYDETNGLLQNNVRTLLMDTEGRLWIGSKFGLNLYANGKLRAFTIHQGMPNDNVWCAYQDTEGDLWFGTDGAGAMRYAGDRFVTYTVKDGLCSDQVMCITSDEAGDLWLGTYGNGICRMDGMAMVTTLDGLPNNTIWSGLRTRDGALWFGTSDGLCRMRNGTVEPMEDSVALRGQRVLSIMEDPDGGIWCGTREGISRRLSNGTVLSVTPLRTGALRAVRDLHRDRRGRLWAACEQGVARQEHDQWTMLPIVPGKPAVAVHCLAEDASGRIWAGTANGLACFADSGYRTILIGTDFASNFISLLQPDLNGMLWAGTNNGLHVFHPDSLLAGGTTLRIGRNDGLRDLECNLNASFQDERGRIFLGTAGGMVIHLPVLGGELDSGSPPRMFITGLRSFLRPSSWEGQTDGHDTITGLPSGLRLPYQRNHLTFDYTGINLSAPEQVRYRYRLLDWDPDWLPATNVRFASYSNLPHGHYTFQVMAAGRNGVWGAPTEFHFEVLPPFWSRWWFYVLAVLFVASVIGGILRYRSIQRERKEKTRQLMLRSRMLQLEQQALNANMNRHFVFNALNSIQYHINRQDRTTANRYLTSFAKLIRKNLDASQNDTTTLAEELERLELYLVLEHMRFKDKFSYTLCVAPSVESQLVHVPAMMLQPYVENSIWHGILPTERPGHVLIDVRSGSARTVVITISDNGMGIDRSRASRNHESDHISRGIEITKGRADVLRKLQVTDIRITGPEQVHGTLGEVTGTRVLIELPCNPPSQSPQENLRNAPAHVTFGT